MADGIRFVSDAGSRSKPKLVFRQLFEKESCTYTYLLGDVGHPDRPALVSCDLSFLLVPFED